MGFLSSLKRLFFTTESVAKSAVNQAIDYSQEKKEALVEAAKESVSDISEKAAGLRETVIEKANVALDKVENAADTAWDKTKEMASDLADSAENAFEKVTEVAAEATDKVKEMAGHSENKVNTPPQSSEFVESSYVAPENVNSQNPESDQPGFLDKTQHMAEKLVDNISENEMVQKATKMAENIGSKVMETGAVVAEKAGEISENVGAKVIEASDKTWDKISEAKDVISEKAKEVAESLGKKFDETVEKAEKYLAEEESKPKKEFSDETLDAGGSLLENKDDFFSKAAQYADGNYDAFSEGKITVSDMGGDKTKTPAKTAGQDDHDGDGNEQIDDAIIVEN